MTKGEAIKRDNRVFFVSYRQTYLFDIHSEELCTQGHIRCVSSIEWRHSMS